MTTSSHIEALLFWKNEAVSISWLATTLGKSKEEITQALGELSETLKNRGVTLLEQNDEVVLKTNSEASELIQKLSKEELVKELTPSALETLTIILYRGPVTKKEIDYIRGVNSGFILRNLLIRGLVQKSNSEAGKGIVYSATLDLLSLLGISKLEELEGYEQVKKEIEEFKEQSNENI